MKGNVILQAAYAIQQLKFSNRTQGEIYFTGKISYRFSYRVGSTQKEDLFLRNFLKLEDQKLAKCLTLKLVNSSIHTETYFLYA